jgi:hypothetical protein
MGKQDETCPHLMRLGISSCGAGDLPYVPSIFELDEYCTNSRHARCPFFIGTRMEWGDLEYRHYEAKR